MLEIGSWGTRTCEGMSRRSFVRAGLVAPFAALMPSLGERSQLQASESKAKSILLVWLGGGPSHLDMFDPKPKAPVDYRGPFATIATRTPGVRFTEVLPRMAARSDRFSLIRSNVNFNGGHREAGSIALTGGNLGPSGYPPNFGSIISRHRGADDLPPFMSIAKGPIGDGDGPVLGYGGGPWGRGYDPFMLNCSETGAVEVAELKLLDGLSPARLSDRQLLLHEVDLLQRKVEASRFGQWDKLNEKAHNLLTSSEAARVFDLSREPEPVRRAYGQTSFGQSCLLGRRLVEAGVPYVQVNWSQYVEVYYPFSDYGWDTHADNFSLLADWHCPLLDRVFSTLLDDLQQRGLLETTLLVCMGEFGRTPRINNIGSRDHWHHCYFSIWAGGGIQPGRVVGESDPRGEHPASNPVTPAMAGATMLELMGISTAARAEMRVLEGGRTIEELL